jgi:hypothetical protein
LGAAGSAVAGWLLYRPGDVNRAYFGTDSRAQALLIGCALAAYLSQFGRRVSTAGRHLLLGVLAALGAGGTIWLWSHAVGTDAWLYHGGLTAAALAVAAVLAHAVVSPSSPTARLLSVPPLIWLGRISYGVYLWHWPLFQFVTAERTHLSGLALLGLRCALTLAAAVSSYVLVERPIRRGTWLRRLPRPVPVGGAVTAMALTAVVAVLATMPATTLKLTGAPPVVVATPPGPAAVPSLASSPPPMQRPGRKPGAQPRIDILGDSVAWTIGAYLPSHPGVTVTNRAIEGCGITLQADILEMGTPHSLYPYCPSWPTRWKSAVNTDDPDVSVILLNRWELMDARLGGTYQHVGQPQFDAYLMKQLDQAVSIASSRGAHVVLLTGAYTHRSERPDGSLYDEDKPARVDAWNALLRQEVARHPGTTTVLDLGRLVCPNGTFTWNVGGVPVRSDGLHFTPAGVQQIIAPWLLPKLANIAATGTAGR